MIIINKRVIGLLLVTVTASVILMSTSAGLSFSTRANRYLFENKKAHKLSFQLNPSFIEQEDYCSIFNKKANVVMLGNSLTYRMNWDELLNRNDVVNRGVGSDITDGLAYRLKYVIPLKPKICFIEGGVNDLDKGIEKKTIISNLEKIVDELKQNSIIPVLMTVTFVAENYEDCSRFNNKIRLLNDEIIKLSDSRSIRLIDLNAQVSSNDKLRKEFSEKDGIHLTSKAYIIWKNEIESVLKSYSLL